MMRSRMHFLMTAAIVVCMTALAWRFGYSAGVQGERDDVAGGLFVALGFLVILGMMKWLGIVWRSATAAGAGVSPFRYIVYALGVIAAAFVMLAVLAPLALAGNSFSLGIVMALLAAALLYESKREGFLRPSSASQVALDQHESAI